jgi:hypothetical protein
VGSKGQVGTRKRRGVERASALVGERESSTERQMAGEKTEGKDREATRQRERERREWKINTGLNEERGGAFMVG